MSTMFFLLAISWFGFGNPVFHLPVLAFFLPIVFIWIGLRYSFFEAFKKAWILGSFAHALYLYWVFIPVHRFGSLAWFLAIWCPVLLGVYIGFYLAVFSSFVSWFRKDLSWFFLGIFSGSLWALLEFVRSKVLTGFPWLTLTQGFAKWPSFVQFSGVVGSFGLSGLFISSLMWLLLGNRSHRAPLLGFFLILFLVFYGKWSLRIKTVLTHKENVTIVQGNIPQSLKWDLKYINFTLDTYLGLTKQAILKHNPRIVIWPETAIPFYLQEDSPFSRRIREFVKKHRIYLITGSPAYERRGGRFYLYNRLYLIGPDGRIKDYYDKEHLVPFGEYVPLKKILFFLDKLVVGAGDFVPGNSSHPFYIDELRLGPLICYEVIFQDMVQERILEDSNILINVSNDAWFGNSSGPYQHLNQAILRCVEQGRYLIRATNTGISAFINDKGEVVKKLLLYKRGFLNFKVGAIKKRTFFSKNYSLIYSFLFLINVIFLLYKAKKSFVL